MYGFYQIKYHLKDLLYISKHFKGTQNEIPQLCESLSSLKIHFFPKIRRSASVSPLGQTSLNAPLRSHQSVAPPPFTQNPNNPSWLPSVQRSSSSMQRFSWIAELPLLSKREADRPSPETSAELLASSILFSLSLSKKSYGHGEKSKGKIKESFASSEPKPMLLLPMHLNWNLLPSSLQSHYWRRGWIWHTSKQLCIIYLQDLFFFFLFFSFLTQTKLRFLRGRLFIYSFAWTGENNVPFWRLVWRQNKSVNHNVSMKTNKTRYQGKSKMFWKYSCCSNWFLNKVATKVYKLVGK